MNDLVRKISRVFAVFALSGSAFADSLTVLESYTIPEYNQQGHKVKEAVFSPGGVMNSYTVFFLDSTGRQMGEKSYDKDSSLIGNIGYQYDIQARVARVSFLNKRDLTVRYEVNDYTPAGLVSRTRSFYKTDSLERCDSLFYDENRYLIRKKIFSGANALKVYATFINDSAGNPVRKNTYAPNDGLLSYAVFEYDARNMPVLAKQYKGDNHLIEATRFVNEYDSWGRPVKISRYR